MKKKKNGLTQKTQFLKHEIKGSQSKEIKLWTSNWNIELEHSIIAVFLAQVI